MLVNRSQNLSANNAGIFLSQGHKQTTALKLVSLQCSFFTLSYKFLSDFKFIKLANLSSPVTYQAVNIALERLVQSAAATIFGLPYSSQILSQERDVYLNGSTCFDQPGRRPWLLATDIQGTNFSLATTHSLIIFSTHLRRRMNNLVGSLTQHIM